MGDKNTGNVMTEVLPPRRRRLRARARYTLIEVLIVLAIIALLVALVGPRLFSLYDRAKAKPASPIAALAIPRIPASIDQAMAHGEYLQSQQKVLALRRQTFPQKQGLRLVSRGESADDPAADPPLAEAQLGPGWSYKLSQPID